MDIHNTPKYARRKGMRRGNRSKGIEGGKRSSEIEDFSGETVCKIGGSSNSFRPKNVQVYESQT